MPPQLGLVVTNLYQCHVDRFRCIAKAYQTVPGLLKELTILAIVYNLVRMVVWHSATHQPIGMERISFIDALRWLGAPSIGGPVGGLIINPIRPHRVEPRVKKRRSKSFPLMIKLRQELRRQLVQ